MKKRSAILICAGAISLLAVGIGLWFATMPYPVSLWWDAFINVRYSAEWPISWLDFVAAKRLVSQELGWREIITHVRVTAPDEIEITTLSYDRGFLAAAGNGFIVKKINGRWTIVQRMCWMS